MPLTVLELSDLLTFRLLLFTKCAGISSTLQKSPMLLTFHTLSLLHVCKCFIIFLKVNLGYLDSSYSVLMCNVNISCFKNYE